MIEGKVPRYQSLLACPDPHRFTLLLQVDRIVPDRSNKPFLMGRPMKHLSRIQCFLEIKSRSREGFQAGHAVNLDRDGGWCKGVGQPSRLAPLLREYPQLKR